jgi:hypothetical protein
MALVSEIRERSIGVLLEPKTVLYDSTTYALNDAVQFNGTSYISIQAGNLNHQPETSPTFWSILSIGIQSYGAVADQWINAIGTDGSASIAQPADADLSVTDVTTNNVSTSAHGFAPKLRTAPRNGCAGMQPA